MLSKAYKSLESVKEPVPNQFTVAMGKLVQGAREEAGISQAELARLIHCRQATISNIENGKSEVGSGTLALLAVILNKPLTYFYPKWVPEEITTRDINLDEQELLTYFRHIKDAQLQKIATSQVKVLADLHGHNHIAR